MHRELTASMLMLMAAGCTSPGAGRESGMDSERSIHLDGGSLSSLIPVGERPASAIGMRNVSQPTGSAHGSTPDISTQPGHLHRGPRSPNSRMPQLS